MTVKEIYNCRICGSDKLTYLFSLGDMYISTFVKNKGENIGKAPLILFWCENCTLVQLKHTAPQELLYSGHYWYRSGLNKVIIDDLKEIVEKSSEIVQLRQEDTVMDIGANDGTLLSFYPNNIKKIGCEPAKNLIEEMKKKCDIAINDFWSFDSYKKAVG